MKRLISGLLCSMLVLGLVSNNGVSNSHAEENVVTSDQSGLSESLVSDNTIEQKYDPSTITENENSSVSKENTSELREKVSDQSNDNSIQNSSDLTESDTSKNKDVKSVLSVTQNQATTVDGQELDIQHIQYEIKDNSIVITGYSGQKEDLIIPSKIKIGDNTLPVKIKITKGASAYLFPNTVHSITFKSIDGTKVGLVNNTDDGNGVTLDYLFAIDGVIYNNLTTVDFSGLDMDNVISMRGMFNGNMVPNLTSIDFGDNKLTRVADMSLAFTKLDTLSTLKQNWTFGSLQNMYEMFWMSPDDESQLTSIGNTKNWNTSTVTNMQGMFLNCVKLENLDLSQWNTSNVTDMSNMFWNCQRLSSIGDTSNWNVSKVTNFSGMFYNCASLSEIRMDNWDFQQLANIGGTDVENPSDDNPPMFYLYSRGYEPLPALIVTSNKQLIDYPYAKAGYEPSCEIRINTNTGTLPEHLYWDRKYDKDTDLSYYFYQTAIPTDQYNELSKLSGQDLQNKVRKWLEDNVPTKTNYALTGWAPTDEDFEQKIQSITDFNTFMNSKEEFTANWVSDKFDTSSANTKLTPSGSLGLAYYPTTFTIGSTDLQSSGQQEIPITKTDSFNVGVKDRTRTKNEWHVTAQLIWNGTSIPEAYIQATNNGTVMQNVSTGSGTYNSATDLKTLQGSGITGTANYQITTTANTIMKSTNGGSIVNNGVYDYDLGEAKLVIPDVSQVRAGTYSGRVEWNLVNAPE